MDDNQNHPQLNSAPHQAANIGLSPLGQQVTGSQNPYGTSQSSLELQINSLPPEANDIDLIEKEWVTHLKYIVSKTAGNPYLQQQEISKAKADYMRKRYNKDIKLAEG